MGSDLKSAGILALGFFVAGLAIATGLAKVKQSERFVAVKGLAERAVTADQGTWTLVFEASGESLDAAIAQNQKLREQVLAFLGEVGFAAEEIRPGVPRVQDQSEFKSGASRFSVSDSVLVISRQVERVSELGRRSNELLRRGVPLAGWEKPMYYFTDLASIKPQMIEEATKDARRAAEQFARDSQSQVGKIRQASQGLFSFRGESEGLAENEQIRKIARVVLSVEYLIVD